MNPVNNLSYLINHLAAVIGKQLDQTLKEQLGIGLSQYRILMVLEWNPRIQQKAIADSLGQTEASISRQIKLLKDKRLLTSQVDNLNKRRHISFPTPFGLQVTEAASDLLRKSFSSDLANINDNQIIKLTDNLIELHKIVCRPGKTGACDHQLGL